MAAIKTDRRLRMTAGFREEDGGMRLVIDEFIVPASYGDKWVDQKNEPLVEPECKLRLCNPNCSSDGTLLKIHINRDKDISIDYSANGSEFSMECRLGPMAPVLEEKQENESTDDFIDYLIMPDGTPLGLEQSIEDFPENDGETASADGDKSKSPMQRACAGRVYAFKAGNTYSCAAMINGKSPLMIENVEKNSELINSTVYVNPDNTVLVGENSTYLAENGMFSGFVDWIGRSSEEGCPVYASGIMEHTPAELTAYMFSGMIEYANFSGEYPENVVLTCPANFDKAAIADMRKAGEIAGLNVLKVVPEPVAAGAYYMSADPFIGNDKLLVLDYGGENVNISLLEVKNEGKNGEIGLLANRCLRHSGGRYLDDRVNKLLREAYCREFEVADSEINESESKRMQAGSEAIRSRLSTRQRAKYKGEYADRAANLLINRETFETACSDIFDEVLKGMEALLTENKLEHGDIRKVILAGGVSNTPKVRELVTAAFGDRIYFDSPDKIAVKGAAIAANSPEMQIKGNKIVTDSGFRA